MNTNKLRGWATAVPVTLFILPLLLGVMWGVPFSDHAYITLRYARNLGAGSGLTYHTAAGATAPALFTPLLASILAFVGRLGLSLPVAALVLSSLGWSVQLVIIYEWARRRGRIVGGVIAALLIVLSPFYLQSLGTELSWLLVWGWLVIMFFGDDGLKAAVWWTRPLLIFLLLLTHFSLETIGLALLLIGLAVVRRQGWLAAVGALLAASFVWIWLAGSGNWPLSTLFQLDSGALLALVRQLWRENEMYSLLLPFIALGGWGFWRDGRRAFLAVLLGWFAAASLAGNDVSLAALALFSAGMGVAELLDWLTDRKVVRLTPAQLTGAGLLMGAVLALAPAVSLLRMYAERPFSQRQYEREIAAWIEADAQPAASLLASERVAFLTGLAAVPTDGRMMTDADYQAHVLGQHPPDYLVFSDSADWLRMSQTTWFRERYAPLQAFPVPMVADPYTIWGYRYSPFNVGQRQLMQVISEAGIEIVGHQFTGGIIEPGMEIETMLFFRAKWPLSKPFYARLHLDAMSGGTAVTQNDHLMPLSIPWQKWQTGQLLTERLSLTIPNEIAYGAYRVSVSLHNAETMTSWPLHQDDDATELDRATVGFLAVPWPTAVPDDHQVNASFGDSIKLQAFTLSDEWQPGGTVDLTLYWEAVELPPRTYFLFIHLLDEKGELALNINEQTTQGEFPMAAWYPGVVIHDEHFIDLPDDLSAGRYQLSIGLFDLDSGERLPLRDAAGQEIATGSLLLTEIVVP